MVAARRTWVDSACERDECFEGGCCNSVIDDSREYSSQEKSSHGTSKVTKVGQTEHQGQGSRVLPRVLWRPWFHLAFSIEGSHLISSSPSPFTSSGNHLSPTTDASLSSVSIYS